MSTVQSESLFARANIVTPGGVNSPVRAFKSVGGTPRFIAHASGAHVTDVDGNKYIDYVLSWGPMVLGHAHPHVVQKIHEAALKGTSFGAPTEAEVLLAEKLCALFDGMDLIRFVNSGTEATMSAIRLARAATGRRKIIKFAGNYHGHCDPLLAQAGSGVATLSLPESAGVLASSTNDTLVLPFQDATALHASFADFGDEIAAVIIEPIAGNMGFVKPPQSYLHKLRALCTQHGALLILDEVMTGFRAAIPGAQTLYGVTPDITCLGKVIGGGLPVAAYGGRREIMQHVAPLGSMYQAGTLSGNPLGMAAGLATLEELLKPGVHDAICARTKQLCDGFAQLAFAHNIRLQVGHQGSMFGLFLIKDDAEENAEIIDYVSAKRFNHTERYARFFHHMLQAGHYLAPSAYEAGFMSIAHTSDDIASTLAAAAEFFAKEQA